MKCKWFKILIKLGCNVWVFILKAVCFLYLWICLFIFLCDFFIIFLIWVGWIWLFWINFFKVIWVIFCLIGLNLDNIIVFGVLLMIKLIFVNVFNVWILCFLWLIMWFFILLFGKVIMEIVVLEIELVV